MPEDGLVTAPCDGTIAYVPDTKHAIALTSTKGVEVLIHVESTPFPYRGRALMPL